MLAFMSKQEASDYKKLMIEAIIAGSIEPPREKKKDKRKVVEVE